MPAYATPGAAAMDLLAAVAAPVVVPPGGRVLIPTGLRVALPAGHEWQIRPRSGLALKHGVTLVNAPGTIDEDYRGEVGVILLNTGAEDTVDRHLELFEVSFGGVVPGGVLRGQSGIDFGGDLFEMHSGE